MATSSLRNGGERRPQALRSSALNPESGDHAITSEPRELEAALRAGALSWEQMPYYAQRYGDRGKEFARSDSAWIALLRTRPAAQVEEQALWLARVLSSRGMPRWLLEMHLRTMYAELARAVPEHTRSWKKLDGAADVLAERRRRFIDDDALERLEAAFDQRVGARLAGALPRVGALLGAAVADEADGIARAVSSVTEWLAETSRFPKRWVDAVNATAQEARAIAGRKT